MIQRQSNKRYSTTIQKHHRKTGKKRICFLSIMIFSTILCTTNLFGLDTTETFSVGPVTEFEGYYTMGADTEGRHHGLELLIGGGLTGNFSYNVTSVITMTDSTTEVSGIGFGFIWTIVDSEAIALDFMPYGGIDACCQKGHITYPGLDAWSFGADMEINFQFIKTVKPFLQSGFGAAYDKNQNKLHWAIPLAAGVMVPLTKNTEFLLQAGWAPADEHTWYGSERTLGIGLNAKLTPGLELITEAGWEFSGNNLSLNLGLIYAL